MMRGMRIGAFCLLGLLSVPGFGASSSAAQGAATISDGGGVISVSTACADAAAKVLAESLGEISTFDVAFFESEETQAALLSSSAVAPTGPPGFPGSDACGGVYGSDTDGCDACCGRLWGRYVRWCGTQPNCQACQDRARDWRRQCEQGCVNVATWTYPELCSETYTTHRDCFNCCVTLTNDMNRWCQLAYPSDAAKRNECLDNVMNWTLSCLGACPQAP